MKRGERRIRRMLSPVALGALVAGCGAVLSYPEPASESTAAACSDGTDNDYNGLVDCGDPACAAFCVENTAALCQDGKDDDKDGLVDCKDPDCASFCVENTAALCQDGRDNDGDGKTDCQDSDCKDSCPESSAATCADHDDNNFNGLVDCDDPSCDGFCPEKDAKSCVDGRDNDGDGVSDGADPGCWGFGAPVVSSCATSGVVDFAYGFEYDGIGWTPFGFYQPPASPNQPLPPAISVAKFLASSDRPGRDDSALGFAIDSSVAPSFSYWYSPDGGVVSVDTFSGPWDGFSFDFSARIVEHSSLSVAFEASSAIKAGKAPPAGLDAMLAGIVLDARNAPFLALRAGGNEAKVPLALPSGGAVCTSPLGALYCDGGWVRVSVRATSTDVVATVSGATTAEVRTSHPAQHSVPPSNVVIRGASAGAQFSPTAPSYVAEYDAYVDDLSVHFAPDSPCGVDVPQIPFGDVGTCDGQARGPAASTGASVSVAASADGYCALVTEGSPASTLAAFRSTDGKAWMSHAPASAGDAGPTSDAAPGGPDGGATVDEARIAIPDGTVVTGAGITYDAKAALYRAAIVWAHAGSTELATSSSADCVTFTAPVVALTLPPDAEAPSPLVDEQTGEQIVLYTRPPVDVAGRTVWRARSTDGTSFAVDPLPLSELPVELFALPPVAFGRVGKSDLVATFPRSSLSGAPGLAFASAVDGEGRGWAKAGDTTALAPSGELGTFDGDEMVSGAIAWTTGTQGLLLYGGRGQRFTTGGSGGGANSSPVTAGTAIVRAATAIVSGTWGTGDGGTDGGTTDAGAPPRCGDGTCDPSESCASCEIDCSCAGTTLLQDRVETPAGWTTSSSHSVYLDREAQSVDVTAGTYTAGFVSRSLGADVDGDFELELTLRLRPASASFPSYYGSCNIASIGLAEADPPAYFATRPAGAYLTVGVPCSQLTGYSALLAQPDVTLSLASGGTGTSAPLACTGVNLPNLHGVYRALLRREAGTVTVTVREAEGCELPAGSGATTTYTGALPALTRLLVWGGSGCGISGIEVDDFVVRRLHDPGSCPAGDTLCGGSCTDTQKTPEHCGACDAPCGAGRPCVAGVCACPSGSTACGSACVDTTSDRQNCGGCAIACAPGKNCGASSCSSGTCGDPFVVPAGGGSFPLDLQAAPTSAVCGAPPSIVFAWTPSKAGTASVEALSLNGTIIQWMGLYADATCTQTLTCGLSLAGFHVDAGVTYRVGLGIKSGSPLPLTLKVTPP